MKRTFYILTLALGLLSCNSNSKKNADAKSTDTLQTPTTAAKLSNIFIKDKSQYSQNFIDELTASNYTEPIKLIDNLLIVGADTARFPDDLEINQKTVFRGTKNNQSYELVLIRINQTTLIFTLELNGNNKIVLPTVAGEATLGAMFFLAPEGDHDEQTGTSYGSYEYWSKDKGCWSSIRVGIGKDTNKNLRAKIIFSCNKKELNLEECPILRTE